MADKFKGGELWITNWGSGEDLKVNRIQDSYVKLTAASSCKSIPLMPLVLFPSRLKKCQQKRLTRVASERSLLFVSFLFLHLIDPQQLGHWFLDFRSCVSEYQVLLIFACPCTCGGIENTDRARNREAASGDHWGPSERA